MKFSISNIDALREQLYYSQVHDAEMIGYRFHNATLIMELLNAVQNVRILIRFEDIVTIQYRHGGEYGDIGTVLSLTVEDGVQGEDVNYDNPNEVPLYLLFQMLSADELLIGAKTVSFENTPI